MEGELQLPKLFKKNRSILAFEQAYFELLKVRPCEKIFVSDILEQSGYSRTAFYYHFQEKTDFIEKTMSAEIAEYVHAIYDTIRNTSPQLFNGYQYLPALELFRHVYKQHSLYHALLHEEITGWTTLRFTNELHQHFLKLVRVSLNDVPNLSYELYSYTETARYLNCITFWDQNNFCYTPEYMAEQVGMHMIIQNRSLLDSLPYDLQVR